MTTEDKRPRFFFARADWREFQSPDMEAATPGHVALYWHSSDMTFQIPVVRPIHGEDDATSGWIVEPPVRHPYFMWALKAIGGGR